ncbi:GspH/FimT family protein [Candidatus Halobeggiatoa sp. HSG11]|nr:GspH/FimT family protein [Candidatus Halobeggiatoa sp. HSG11]
MKNQTAFTLIELVVVVVLIIILTMFAIPNVRSLLINNRIVTKNNQLIHAINYARSEAIINANRIIQIQQIDDDWSNGWEIVDASNDTLLRIFEFKGDSIKVTNPLPKFRYTSRGYLQSTITFNICNADYPKGRQITVRRSGRAVTDNFNCN